jgi:glucose-6-phosphate isomerase
VYLEPVDNISEYDFEVTRAQGVSLRFQGFQEQGVEVSKNLVFKILRLLGFKVSEI